MSTTYPAAIQSFVNPTATDTLSSPAHADQHADINDTVEALQAVLGTTAGTSVLKFFNAGDFPLKVDSGGTVVGTYVFTSGTFNNVTLGTPNVTGGTITGGMFQSGTIKSPQIAGYDGWQEVQENWNVTGVDGSVRTGTITANVNATTIYTRGMKLKWTQGGTNMQGFISGSPSFAGSDTTLIIYTGTAYTMGTSAITNFYYSTERTPYRFVMNPTWWQMEVTSTSTTNQGTPTDTTWYNVGTLNITIPVGVWNTEFAGAVYGFDSAGVALMQVFATLSTANNTESDKEFTGYAANRSSIGTAVSEVAGPFYKRKVLELSAKSQRFVNVKSQASSIDDVGLNGGNVTTVVRVTPVWL